jgi:Domain of unknown function (DUF1707)
VEKSIMSTNSSQSQGSQSQGSQSQGGQYQGSQDQAGQSWSRGFAPLFRGPSSDQHLRVSDADRQAVADRLGEHFAEGRLDQAEFDERAGRAMSAKTRADLSGLFDDLPDANVRPQAGAAAVPVRRSGRRHPVLVLVLLVIVTVAAAHAVVAATVPWLWLGFLAAIVFIATRGTAHARASQDR